MVDIEGSVHDRLSVEFKIAYPLDANSSSNEFVVNTWIFAPESLDLGRDTYNKELFYRDIKSYVRLITPVFSLKDLSEEDSLPFMFLIGSVEGLKIEYNEENIVEFQYQMKMFGAIFRSAMRKETLGLLSDDEISENHLYEYIDKLIFVLNRFRSLRQDLQMVDDKDKIINFFTFCDEFISSIIEVNIFQIIEGIKADDKLLEIYKSKLFYIAREEIHYRRKNGYITLEEDDEDANRRFLYRRGILKKYMNSQLFLDTKRKKDGVVAQQVYYSIAAGISMIVATAIGFSFRQKYDNFTMPLFVALVVTYILKDRIKDFGRYVFAAKLSKKYFDVKRILKIKGSVIGNIREAMDFVSETKVPEKVMKIRSRSDLLEVTNKISEENIILHRKILSINGGEIDKVNQYETYGINEIVRFNLSRFIQRMDDPNVPVAIPQEGDKYKYLYADKIYYVNFVLGVSDKNETKYHRFRFSLSQDGIHGMEKLF